MIKLICDRCGTEMSMDGRIGYMAWNWRSGPSGDLDSENPFERCHFCKDCMNEFASFLGGRPSEKKDKPEKKAEKKPVKRVDSGKMMALRNAGWSNQQIAEEMNMSRNAVAVWFSSNKKKEGGTDA